MSKIIGLDIGSYEIKAVESNLKTFNFKLDKLVSIYNPVGQYLPSEEIFSQRLSDTIKELFKANNFYGGSVYLNLPSDLSFSTVISLPYLTDTELASSIHWEAEQHIPIPLDEVNLEYEVLYKPTKDNLSEKMKVLLVAARKTVISDMVDLLNHAGVEVSGVKPTVLGVSMAVSGQYASMESAALVCHFGAASTEILVFSKGHVALTYSIKTGSLAITKAIEKNLNLSPQQAEQYKRQYGLLGSELQGQVRNAILPIVNLLVSEIRKAVQYYETSSDSAGIQKLVMSGGGSYLPGLQDFLIEKFGYDTHLIQPFNEDYWSLPSNYTIPQDIAKYSGAIGLSLHES